MKQLEIKTNKRLLIVEVPENTLNYWGLEKVVNALINSTIHIEKQILVNDTIPNYKFICKGSDLTEDIAKGFVHLINENYHLSYYADYNNKSGCGYYTNSIQSFISAIEASGYHWGENPVKEPPVIMYDDFNPWAMQAHDDRVNAWKESESRTFNPSKCIIFEII